MAQMKEMKALTSQVLGVKETEVTNTYTVTPVSTTTGTQTEGEEVNIGTQTEVEEANIATQTEAEDASMKWLLDKTEERLGEEPGEV